MEIKALSVRDPWASLLADGHKTIELRTWTTTHRGPLLICAGQCVDPRGARHAVRGVAGTARAIVDLRSIREATIGDADAAGLTKEQMHGELLRCIAEGKTLYAWIVDAPLPVEPIRISGKLGIFTAHV